MPDSFDIKGRPLCAAANRNDIYLALVDKDRNSLRLMKTIATTSLPPPTNITDVLWETVTTSAYESHLQLRFSTSCAVDERGNFIIMSNLAKLTVDEGEHGHQAMPYYSRILISSTLSTTDGGKISNWQEISNVHNNFDHSNVTTLYATSSSPSLQDPPQPMFVIAAVNGRSIQFAFLDQEMRSFSHALNTSITLDQVPDLLVHSPGLLSAIRLPLNDITAGEIKGIVLDSRNSLTGQMTSSVLTTNATKCRANDNIMGTSYKDRSYYICQAMAPSDNVTIHILDNQLTSRTVSTNSLGRALSGFIPFPVHGDGEATWALFHDDKSLYGLDISGSTAGQWHTETPVPIRVLDNASTDLKVMERRDLDDDDDDDVIFVQGRQTGLSGGAITGIIIGVLVLAVTIGFLVFFYRQKRKQKGRQREQSSTDGYCANGDLVKGDNYTYENSPDSKQLYVESAAHLTSTPSIFPLRQPSTIVSSTPQSLSPAPVATVSTQLQHELQLSSHPRPTFTTSIGEPRSVVLPEMASRSPRRAPQQL